MANAANSPQPRDMRLSDLDDVAEVHRNCFPVSVSIFSALGNDIIKRFYAQAVEESESIATVLEEPGSGRVVGLAIGTMKSGFQKRFLRRHFLRFSYSIFSAFVVNPALRNALCKRFKHITHRLLEKHNSASNGSSVPPANGPEALYIILGVHSQWRGRGNAGRLVNYLVTRMFEAGAGRILGFIPSNNLPSLKLHKRLGWNIKQISTEEVKAWVDRPDPNS
ncbi:hypothetical protein ES707_08243 [subsurface metagenome]